MTYALVRRGDEDREVHRGHHGRTQGEGGIYKPRREVLEGKLDVGFPVSKSVKKQISAIEVPQSATLVTQPSGTNAGPHTQNLQNKVRTQDSEQP